MQPAPMPSAGFMSGAAGICARCLKHPVDNALDACEYLGFCPLIQHSHCQGRPPQPCQSASYQKLHFSRQPDAPPSCAVPTPGPLHSAKTVSLSKVSNSARASEIVGRLQPSAIISGDIKSACLALLGPDGCRQCCKPDCTVNWQTQGLPLLGLIWVDSLCGRRQEERDSCKEECSLPGVHLPFSVQ